MPQASLGCWEVQACSDESGRLLQLRLPWRLPGLRVLCLNRHTGLCSGTGPSAQP